MTTSINQFKVIEDYNNLKKSVKGSDAIVTFLAYNLKCQETEVRRVLEKAGILSPKPVKKRKAVKGVLTSKPEKATAQGPIPAEYRAIVNYIWEKYEEVKGEHEHSDVFTFINVKHYPFEKREGEEYRLWSLALEQCRKLNKTLSNKSLTEYPKYKVRELEI